MTTPVALSVSMPQRRRHAWLQRIPFERARHHQRALEIDIDALRGGSAPVAELQALDALSKEAVAALDRKDIEACWHYLNIARRRLICLRPPEELREAARTLLVESIKLSSWRRDAIQKLIPPKDDLSTLTASALREALAYRDEFYENRYQRIAMLRDQAKILLGLALSAVVVIMLVARLAAPIDALTIWDWRRLLLVLMFGVVGASFSAARAITAEASRSKIPELLLSNWITLARTAFGAATGLAVYAFLQSKLLNLGAIDLAKVLAVAFAAGFSERLVVKVVESVAGRDKES